MLPVEERVRIDAALAAERQRIAQMLREYAVNTWGSLGSWRDEDIDYFVDLIVPRVQGAQELIADLTTEAILRMLEAEGAFIPAIDVATLRGGVPASEVYRRPAHQTYTALAKGKPLDDALTSGATRLASLVTTDLQLAHRSASREAMMRAASEGLGFRRVLSGVENCAKCMIASTQRYHRGDLLPIHPGCDCGVLPLAPGENVGQVLDPERLEATHDWVQSVAGTSDRGARDLGLGTRDDYADLIAVREHGEFGPTLTWRWQTFTGPADL